MTETDHRLWIRNPLACSDPGAAGGIVVTGTRIVEKVAGGQQPHQPVNETFDASGHVLLPGLVNTHHHFYQTLTRAYSPALNKELFPWLTTLYDVWANLNDSQMALASELAMVELLMSGCTTVADHHYVFSGALVNAIDCQVETAQRLGVRAALTRGSMSVGRDDGGLPPQTVVQDEQTIVDDSQRLIDRYHQRAEGAMTTIALAPCSPFSVSRALMRESARLAENNDVRLHTHLAETEDETAYCQKLFGMRPLDYLEDSGWLTDRTWLAHGIHFNDDEIQRLGRAGTGIAHCPSSNMVLGSGLCRTLFRSGTRSGGLTGRIGGRWISVERPLEPCLGNASGTASGPPALLAEPGNTRSRHPLGNARLGPLPGTNRYRWTGARPAG